MPYPSPVRKFVKSVHPRACIPDLEHRDFLPPAGREVNWSVHWARHEKHGDVRVFDTQEAMDAFTPADTDPSPDIPHVAAKPAKVVAKPE
jgi:hypothetical protein